MSSFNNQNELNPKQQNRPFDQLDHKYERGKKISNPDLEAFAVKIYVTNGKGIIFPDLMNKYKCSKDQAQRRLKNARKEKIDKNGKKRSILFTLDNERTNPQQYYPSCKKANIIEDRRKRENRLIEPTGVRLYRSPYLEKLKARYVSELLSLLQNQPISIHKPSLKLNIDKNYYDEIDIKKVTKGNKSKVHEEKIGLRNVRYEIYPDGTIMIYISCSEYPFKLAVEEDISSFFAFLGQVKDRLVHFISDFSEQAIPPIMDWILIQCDVNQDIDINIIEQLSIPDLQLRIHDRIFRMYVKNINGSSYYRVEESKQINQYVRFAIPEIRNMYMPLENGPYDPSKFRYIQ